MNRYLFILLSAAIVLNYSCIDDSKSEIQIVTPKERQEFSEINDVQFVEDQTSSSKVIELDEYSHLNYFSPNFDIEISKLDKSKPVIVHCESKGEIDECSEKMKNAGFIKISDLDSTIAKWEFKNIEIKSMP